MTTDDTFRLVLACGIVLIALIAGPYRLRSMRTGEKLDRRQEGWFILVGLRLVAVLRMAAIVAFLINPEWVSWSAMPLAAWLRWIGVGLGATALALLTWTLHNLGVNLTDTVVTRRVHTLVTTGPYRWVRHPFYLALTLAVVGDSLMTANWFVLLTGAALIALLMLRTRKEEENLIRRFGDSYRTYADRTGQFLPRNRH